MKYLREPQWRYIVGRDVCPSNLRVSRRPKDPKSFLADKISKKISEGSNYKGCSSACIIRISDDASRTDYLLIPPDAETASILREKHPSKAPSSSSAVTSSPTTPQYHTDESEVLQAIHSFPNGSGGGLDDSDHNILKIWWEAEVVSMSQGYYSPSPTLSISC